MSRPRRAAPHGELNRLEELLDAAISVLGERGIQGLSHRAVDAAAGLPTGSTSNYFRTHDALLNAVVERFAARERANWDDIAAKMCPTTPQDLTRALSAFAQDAIGPNRALTLARYAILVEAGIHPTLRAQLTVTGARVNAWAMNWLRIVGSANPERYTPIIMNHWTGIVLHQLANPDPAFDPSAQIAASSRPSSAHAPRRDLACPASPLASQHTRGHRPAYGSPTSPAYQAVRSSAGCRLLARRAGVRALVLPEPFRGGWDGV